MKYRLEQRNEHCQFIVFIQYFTSANSVIILLLCNNYFSRFFISWISNYEIRFALFFFKKKQRKKYQNEWSLTNKNIQGTSLNILDYFWFRPQQCFLCSSINESAEWGALKCPSTVSAESAQVLFKWLKLGSHRGDNPHRPTSWSEINVVGTINGSSSNLYRWQWISKFWYSLPRFIAQPHALFYARKDEKIRYASSNFSLYL